MVKALKKHQTFTTQFNRLSCLEPQNRPDVFLTKKKLSKHSPHIDINYKFTIAFHRYYHNIKPVLTLLFGCIGWPPPIREYKVMWPSKDALDMIEGLRGHHWISKHHWLLVFNSYTTWARLFHETKIERLQKLSIMKKKIKWQSIVIQIQILVLF